MNDKTSDKAVWEKMQSLDTLQGGIVFGKEETWVRLQARMEQKRVKTVPVKYMLATAAMLLLFVSITTVYYHTSKETANRENEKINIPMNNVSIVQPPAIPVAPPEMRLQKMTGTAMHKAGITSFLKNKKEQQIEAATVTAVQTLIKEVKTDDDKPLASIPAPVPILQKPMKTVHINELEQEDKVQEVNAVAINNSLKIDLKNLPVVHINDVIREESEVRRILKENRGSFVQISFMQQGFKYNDSPDINIDHIPHNFLGIKFNTQN